jgi:hypothetical protein
MKYKHILINEKVLRGLSTANLPVLYVVPNSLTEEEGEILIQAIESNNDLKKIVTTYDVESNTPKWTEFWDILSNIPSVQPVLKAHAGNKDMRKFRISRTRPGVDETNAKVYDSWAHSEDGSNQKTLPSFQDWWTLNASKTLDKNISKDKTSESGKFYGYQQAAHSAVGLGGMRAKG